MKRQSLGQHYLSDQAVVERMVAEAALEGTERAVEIGTGKGALTPLLARRCGRLDAYEVDPENYRATLAAGLGANAFVHLVDAFGERPEFDVLVSSLPYSRSQDFVEWISQRRYRRGVVLLQEDFVRKLLAPPGSRDYRGVSAISQVSMEVREVCRVGRSSFSPPPRVSSLLVAIRPTRTLTAAEVGRVKRLFSLRRREVRSALASAGMVGAGPYGRRRVYSLTPDEVYGLCRDGAGALSTGGPGGA